MNLPEIHITDKPIDAIDIIREKSISGDEDDDPVYICNISDVIKKYSTWTKSMPRVRPFFGEFHLDWIHFSVNSIVLNDF